MCPMRILLIFFSAALAGYFAWRASRREEDEDGGWGDSSKSLVDEKKSGKEEQDLSFREAMERWFWVFVDMANGRYLWRSIKELRNCEKAKTG